jgi:DNA invertase Pin-like site-specific DNA recombinase
MTSFIAYYRVSTERQGRSGLGLDAQRQAVTDYLNGGTWTLIEEFTEIESGKRNDRPQLAAALDACRRHKATLIIAKLDRLARNVAFIATLMENTRGVDFVAADMPEANKVTLHIMAALAEHEREMISQRTKAALQAAKARGQQLGWSMPQRRQEARQASSRGVAVRQQKAETFAANVLPIVRDIEAAGVTTLQRIAKALNARGVSTARGGKWHAATVRNLLLRQERERRAA